MTRLHLILLATLGSAGLLAGAYGFEHVGGMAPCKLCLWQRWPHFAAAGIGLAALVFLRLRLLPWLGALAALTTAGIGAYHTGVERGWWLGPQSCSSQGIEGLTPEALLNQILTAPIVRCEEVAWSMAGLSMASWNALASLALVALWLAAARAR